MNRVRVCMGVCIVVRVGSMDTEEPNQGDVGSMRSVEGWKMKTNEETLGTIKEKRNLDSDNSKKAKADEIDVH